MSTNSTANANQSQNFYKTFSKRIDDTQRDITSAQSSNDLQNITTIIAQLRSDLTNQTSTLPTYDQEAYEKSLRRLNDLLATKRREILPKQKFTFQRKTTAASSGDSSTSSGSTIKETRKPASIASESESQYRSIANQSAKRINRSGFESTSDLHILQCQGCLIDLRRQNDDQIPIAALHVRNLQQCILICNDVRGSVFIHDCAGCVFIVQCQQFRMHSSNQMAVMLSTKSVATIETCKKVEFSSAKLIDDDDTPPRVQDFDHISQATASANWQIMQTDRELEIFKAIQSLELLENIPRSTSEVNTSNAKIGKTLANLFRE